MSDAPARNLADEAFWEEDYLGGVELPSRPDPEFPFERTLAAALAEHAPVERDQRVLEIGAAPGKWLVFYAERFGARVEGIEYTARGAELIRRNFEAVGIGGEVSQQDFFDGAAQPFDLVLSLGFIEHFDDLDVTFARHVEFVGPGGKLVIGVPNYRGVLGALQRWSDGSHLALHNLDAMDRGLYRRLASVNGLKVTYQGYLNGPDPVIVKVGRRSALAGVAVLQRLRGLSFGDRLNAPWLSSYLLTVMERPA